MKFFRQLTFRILFPIVILMLMLGGSIYWFTKSSISDFSQQSIRDNLIWTSNSISSIIDKSLDELLQSGDIDDNVTVKIKQGLTLATLEEFVRQNRFELIVYQDRRNRSKGGDKIRIASEFFEEQAQELINKTRAVEDVTSLPIGGETYLAYHTEFKSWNWHILLFKNDDLYDELIRGIDERSLLVTVSVVLIAMIVIVFMIRRVLIRPISKLEESADKLAHGHLEEEIDISRDNEIGHLAESFSDMRDSIRQQIIELESLNKNLDKRVKERTDELSTAYNQLKEAQAGLVQSEKMASLGQMVAGVAHEINTPLGYVKNNIEMFGDVLEQMGSFGEENAKLIKLFTSPNATDEELSEQVSYVMKLSEVVSKNDFSIVEQSKELVTDSIDGLERISDIVSSLKDFSRLDRSKIGSFDVNKGLDSTLKIAHNILKDKVKIIKNYGNIPSISCIPSQVNQVFLNLITNAAQAVNSNGTIQLTTKANAHYVEVKIQDNGKGIPANILPKICDPFFTTKDVGKGTGLGLSISQKIIQQQHQGRLLFASEVGQGTAAVIFLPIKQRLNKPAKQGLHKPVKKSKNEFSDAVLETADEY